MNAASVVSTSSSSQRNARMMLDMMPSDPLPAITFFTFRSNSSARICRRSSPPLGYRFKPVSDRVIASTALGEVPSGFSLEASFATCSRLYCLRTDSMVRPASYGRSDSIYGGTSGTTFILAILRQPNPPPSVVETAPDRNRRARPDHHRRQEVQQGKTQSVSPHRYNGRQNLHE